MTQKVDFRRWFSKVVYQRGRTSHDMGRVSIVHVDRDSLAAKCRTHHARSEFQVMLSWGEARGKLHAWCTCPDAWNHNPCEHIAAVLFELVDEEVFPPGIAIAPDTLIVRGRNFESSLGQEDEEDRPEPVSEPRGGLSPLLTDDPLRPGAGPGLAASAVAAGMHVLRPAHAWLSVLQNDTTGMRLGAMPRGATFDATRLPADAICYVLDISESLSAGQPVVQLFQRVTRGADPESHAQMLHLTADMAEQLDDERDRMVLSALIGLEERDEEHRYRGYGNRTNHRHHRFPLPGDTWDFALPLLCDTGRFFWSIGAQHDGTWHPIHWRADEPWTFSLVIDEATNEQHYKVRGVLKGFGRTVPIGNAAYLFSERFVIVEDCLAQLHCAAGTRWLRPLVVAGHCEVPVSDRELLQRLLWSLGDAEHSELPPSLQLDVEACLPTGRLRILRPIDFRARAGVPARVEYVYGDRAIAGDSTVQQVVDLKNGKVIPRDAEREQALSAEFTSLTTPLHYFRRTSLPEFGSEMTDEPMVELDPQTIEQSIDQLIKHGWVVEAEGLKVRRASEFTLSVTSGVDWFDVEAAAQFGGIQATLPELLEAIRNNRRFVRLADGSQGILPQQWLEQYRGLAELGEEEGNSLRFHSTQVAILDALLAAQENPVLLDAHYQATRDRLMAFDGIFPLEAHPHFQGTLRDYQRDGLGWLEFLREYKFGGCLADDMGLGKTIQVLAMLQRRAADAQQAGQPRPVTLVVVPKSIVFNWLEEAQRFTPDLSVLNYTGIERHQSLDMITRHHVVVTTYGVLRRDILKLRTIKFDYAVLDEAQAIKNSNSQAAKACRLIQSKFRLAMTGTPVENHLGELWSLFDFLNPGMLGRSRAFQSLVSSLRKTTDEQAGPELRFLAHAVRPFVLRRTKSDVIRELPAKTEHTLYCELTGQQKRLYAELRDYYRQLLNSKVQQTGLKRAKIHVLEALLRLRQAACHPGLLDDERRSQPSAKLELLEEQVQEVISEGHKVLIFSQFTRLLGIVKDRFDTLGIRYEYLDGRTKDRRERIVRFQEDAQVPVFLISLKAGGLGLNLTAADYVYILDPWWNPAVEAQAVDRAHRIGQTRPVIANRIICRDTVEEKILLLQQSKRQLADAIISADSSLLQSLSADDLQLLLS